MEKHGNNIAGAILVLASCQILSSDMHLRFFNYAVVLNVAAAIFIFGGIIKSILQFMKERSSKALKPILDEIENQKIQ